MKYGCPSEAGPLVVSVHVFKVRCHWSATPRQITAELVSWFMSAMSAAASSPAISAEMVDGEKSESSDRRLGAWGSFRKGKLITYMGIVKARVYQDVVENIHSRTGDDLDEIEKNLKDPNLRKYCVLQCFDDTVDEVYGRINRFVFPRFRAKLESITVGHDIVIIVGRKTPGFGNSLAVDQLYVIDPE